jgi:Calcineurin-like phosphoesterase
VVGSSSSARDIRRLVARLGVASLVAVVSAASPAASATREIVAAGDIASKSEGDARTARLVRMLDPDRVLTLGDNAYPAGTATQFANYYDPTWGTFRGRTSPSPGNHDYETAHAAGYFGYFGDRAPARNFWFVVGDWLLVSLDAWSNRRAAQRFLRRSLAADDHLCELAYWHQPRWSSGEHGNGWDIAGLWTIAVRRGVDVVLNGHDHDYERFARLGVGGAPTTEGTREFVVGTGGVGLRTFGPAVRGSQRRIRSFGVLRMMLKPASYSWSFRNPRNRALDTGWTACHP